MDIVGTQVLVTGSNGFIGSHLTGYLLEKGYRIRALVRATSDLSLLGDLDIEYVYGDITSPDYLPGSLEGVEIVFHLAASTKGPDRGTYFKVNLDATRILLRHCMEATGLKRFVFVSSIAAMGPSGIDRRLREEDPARPIGPYGESKLAAEGACREAREQGLPVTIVRPCTVYGPGELDLLRIFKNVKLGISPRIPGDIRTSLIYISDLVDMLERAGRMEAAVGRTYIAADTEPCWWSDYVSCIASFLNRRVVQVPVPCPFVWPVAVVNECLMRMGKRRQCLTFSKIRQLYARFWVVDCTRAREELGWKPVVGIEDGIRRTLEWYREKGLL